MNNEFISFLRKSRRSGTGIFSKKQREKYLGWLDILISNPPRLSENEVKVISRYINRSIGFYLHLFGACGFIGNIRVKFEGCMENIVFLLDYVMYGYSHYIPRKYMEKLYNKSLNLVRFCPISKEKLIEYEIDTGLIEKIHFYLEYYFPK